MEFLSGEAPLTIQQIGDIEAELGLQFPQPLRDFYLRTNGGVPQPYVYEDDTLDTVVSEALPLTSTDTGTAVATYRLLVLERQIVPPWFFPIAVDGGGDYFFVDCRTADARVHFFDSEKLRSLEVSLEEFWARLKPE